MPLLKEEAAKKIQAAQQGIEQPAQDPSGGSRCGLSTI
jgi:hypothetical protein